MKNTQLLLLGTLVTLLAACSTTSELDKQQSIARPEWGAEPILVPTTRQAQTGISASTGENATTTQPLTTKGVEGTLTLPVLDESIAGTWHFTTPNTVTRVSRSTNNIEQVSLYFGRPAPEDKPFVVITTAAEPKSVVDASPDEYTVKESRVYLLNGQPCKEVTGYTKSGRAFCELLVSRGKGDRLHAIAVPATEEQRKLALEILASIQWKEAPK